MSPSHTPSLVHPGLGPQCKSPSPHRASIHILDDDALFNVFCLYRTILFYEDGADDRYLLLGGDWARERWWQRLVSVCSRWRNLILASPSSLHLCLICTYGTPVAEMFAHSPPLPVVVDYADQDREVTAEDEQGMLLALRQRDRVRRVRLHIPTSILRKLFLAMDEEFPMLEDLYVAPRTKHNGSLTLPGRFQAPNLHRLALTHFAFPIRSPLLTAGVGLVTLSLRKVNPSAYFRPNDLLELLLLVPQLETLSVTFHYSPILNHDVRMRLLHTQIKTSVTLPNLRYFRFGGVSAYLEALLPQITTPLLERLQIRLFFNQLTFSLPHLLHFMSTTKKIVFSSARFMFSDEGVAVKGYPHEGAKTHAFFVHVGCRHLDWQVSSTAQIFDALRPLCSAVVHLVLGYKENNPLSKWRNEADRAKWRGLLRSFSNVKTLCVHNGLVSELSRSLQSDDGESPLELLPELKELVYSAGSDTSDAFTAFIDARQIAGRPVALVHP
ncbi:hypothetical protein DFH94DRAFT_852486 [Russula ochroleuca]|uniref:Uncharacterized protein n=1 Tax=Russula ochroleuca TaxID=152965 RepID=A0A9P5MY38_9AGAM|nr:hypothetical protein DFH94DRAFT_852486 [Russula ochroleuca]